MTQTYSHAFAVTPSDANPVNPGFTIEGFYVGGAGNVAIQTLGGETVTFIAVIVGTIYPMRYKKVMATNTTATSIVAIGD